jgi:7-cyano-7-deazaguanine synthase in queuosine biosynthesis
MSFVDGLLAAGILAAAGWIFYRSFIRKKGPCAGCEGCASRSCGFKEQRSNNRLIHIQEK